MVLIVTSKVGSQSHVVESTDSVSLSQLVQIQSIFGISLKHFTERINKLSGNTSLTVRHRVADVRVSVVRVTVRVLAGSAEPVVTVVSTESVGTFERERDGSHDEAEVITTIAVGEDTSATAVGHHVVHSREGRIDT